MARDEQARKCDSDSSIDGTEYGRRSFLKVTGGTLASAALLGSASGATAATTVDIVEAGADDTGQEPVNGVLERVHGNDTEIYFPPGTYRLNPISLSGRNWTLRGAGEGETVLRVPNWVNGNTTYLNFQGHGWEFDGFTVDLSARDAAPINHLKGTDWAFRNVHMKGKMGDPQARKGTNLFYPAVTSSGSSGLIENVYAPDGSADVGDSSNRGGMWFGPNNKGHLTLRGVHMEKFANNTVYGAKSAGPLTIENCFFRNTNVGVRIGGNTVVRDTVWVQDGRVPTQRWSGGTAGRGLWINSNGHTSGDIVVEGCRFIMTGAHATTAINASNPVDDVTIRNTRIQQGNNRHAVRLLGGGTTTVEGVSATGDSAAAAFKLSNRDGSTFRDVCIQQPGSGIELVSSANCAVENSTVNVGGQAFDFQQSNVSTSGISRQGTCPVPSKPDGVDESDGGDAETPAEPNYENELTISGAEHPDRIDYEFEVDGDLAKSTARGATMDDSDALDGATASGLVHRGLDSYTFSGQIVRFDVTEGAVVYLNGDRVDPAKLGQPEPEPTPEPEPEPTPEPTPEPELTETLTIYGQDMNRDEYSFTVSGGLRQSDAGGATIDAEDSVSGGTATGHVVNYKDSYAFSGEITDFQLDGTAKVILNGEEVDPDSLGAAADEPEFTEVITIYGQDMNRDEYAFSVSGALRQSDAGGATIDAEDSVSDNTAVGHVVNYKDSYAFSGEITDFQLDGTAKVILNGEEVDPDGLGRSEPALPNRIVFDGTDAPAESSYVFAVSGEVQRGSQVENADELSENAVRGTVAGDVDVYRFSGSITDLKLTGDATVRFGDEA